MNIKDLVNKAADNVLQALKLSDDDNKKKEDMEVTATLEDGTVIFSPENEWSQGVAVFTRDADGEPVTLPDGEYTLSTGQVMVVAEGALSELREAQAEEAMSEDNSEAIEQALSKIVDAFTAKLNEVSEQFTAQVNELKAENQALKEKFEATPAKPSAKTEKAKAPVKLSKNDRIGRTLEILQASK